MMLQGYKVKEVLGTGTSNVHLALHSDTDEKVAVKFLKKGPNSQHQDLMREVQALRKLDHPGVISILDLRDTAKHLCLVFPFARGMTLDEYVMSQDEQRLLENEARCIFAQLLDALSYVHEQAVVHRDIKMENIMIYKGRVTLLDFGFSRSVDTQNQMLSTSCGSPLYAAPEVISGKEYDGIRADIWSLGVVLYALVCGYCPFHDENEAALYQKINKGEFQYPDHVSAECRQVINGMLQAPESRDSIEQVRAHPWVGECCPIHQTDCLSRSGPVKFRKHSVDAGDSDTYLDSEVLEELAKKQIPTVNLQASLRAKKFTRATVAYSLLSMRKERLKITGEASPTLRRNSSGGLFAPSYRATLLTIPECDEGEDTW